MADPFSIAKVVVQVAEKLKSAIDQLPENQKDIYALATELINETEDLTNLRKLYVGEHVSELDRLLEGLVDNYEAIYTDLEILFPTRSTRPLKRAIKWSKNIYHADSVRKKIIKLRDRVRDSQRKFLVKNAILTTLSVEDVKGATSELQMGMRQLVQAAQKDVKEANKIFGVDRMTEVERKGALHKTTLDLSVTTREENILILQLKIRTLKVALESGAPTLSKNSSSQITHGFTPDPDDPFYDVYNDPSGTWRRQDALIESISLLGILQSPESMSATPAIVIFIRADSLAWALRSLALPQEALQVCRIAHDVITKASKIDPEPHRGYLAQSLLSLSTCLSDMGDPNEALTISEEAVGIYRALANPMSHDLRPNSSTPLEKSSSHLGEGNDSSSIRESEMDTYASRHNLARSLNNLSIRLSDVGRREDALAAIQEAVALYLSLSGPNIDNSDLALYFNNLSNRLGGLGRRDDSLDAIRYAVAICRMLVRKNPNRFNPTLSMTLNNFSVRLSDVGKREEALAAIQEAVEIHRELIKMNQDTFVLDLAISLTNLSHRLNDAGKITDALVAIQEAVVMGRLLVKKNATAFGPDLAMTLNTLASRLGGAGKKEEALTAIQEAVGIYRSLAEKNPNTFNYDLALSLNTLSNRLREAGKREEALAAIQESVNIRYELAKTTPDAFSSILAFALNDLSNCLGDMGKNEDAVVAIQEAVRIRRELAKTSPEAFIPILAQSLSNLSNRLSEVGRRDEALAITYEAVEKFRTLAAKDPDAFDPSLACALNNLSLHLSLSGEKQGALATILEAVKLRKAQAKLNPDAFEPDLALSLCNLSCRMRDVGKPEEALVVIQDALEIYRRWFRKYPDFFRADLSYALGVFGNSLKAVGRIEAGQIAEQEANKIRQ